MLEEGKFYEWGGEKLLSVGNEFGQEKLVFPDKKKGLRYMCEIFFSPEDIENDRIKFNAQSKRINHGEGQGNFDELKKIYDNALEKSVEAQN